MIKEEYGVHENFLSGPGLAIKEEFIDDFEFKEEFIDDKEEFIEEFIADVQPESEFGSEAKYVFGNRAAEDAFRHKAQDAFSHTVEDELDQKSKNDFVVDLDEWQNTMNFSNDAVDEEELNKLCEATDLSKNLELCQETTAVNSKNINESLENKKSSISESQEKQKHNGDYICNMCPNSKKYSTKQNLSRHKASSHNALKYQCPKCELNYYDEYYFRKHLENCLGKRASKNGQTDVQKIDNYFICTKCTQSKHFSSYQTARRHIRIDHLGIRHKCPRCTAVFRDLSGLKGHFDYCQRSNLSTSSPEKANEKIKNSNSTADFSAFESASQKDMDDTSNHTQRSEQICSSNELGNTANYEPTTSNEINKIKLYICKKCPNSKKFFREKAFQKHIAKRHDGVNYICPTCEYNFFNAENLKNHLERKCSGKRPHRIPFKDIEKKDDYFICNKCTESKKFSCYQTARRHLIAEHLGIRHECSKCYAQYRDAQGLRQHVCRELHYASSEYGKIKNSDASSVSIIGCTPGNNLDDISHALHIQHTEQVCYANKSKNISFASKTFDKINEKNYSIEQGFINNHNVMKYKCSMCKLYCNDLKSYRKHLESKCTVKRAARNSITEIIEKIDDYLICTKCTNSKKYKSYPNIRRHIRIEHEGNMYECSNCNAKFCEAVSLRKHVKLMQGSVCTGIRRRSTKIKLTAGKEMDDDTNKLNAEAINKNQVNVEQFEMFDEF